MTAEAMGDRMGQSIRTMSELQAYCEEGRKAFHQAHDQLSVTADDLKFSVEAFARLKGLGAAQRRMLARRVTRPLQHAADLQDEAAKAIQACYVQAQRAFDAVQDQGRGNGQAFDPEK